LATVVPATADATPSAGATTPTSADRCFVERSTRAFLGRTPTAGEVAAGATRLAAGTTRSAFVADLAASDAWLGATVDHLYREALDRAPDGGGRRYWVDQLRAGTSVNRFGGLVYGADEFYRRSGGTTAGFVSALYSRILGRPADAGGLTHWSTIVQRDGRGPVAAAFFASTESRRDRVTDLYQRLLGRAPDQAGTTYWTGALRSVNDVRLAVSLASSTEYRRRADGCALDATTTAVGTTPASTWAVGLSDDGRHLTLRHRTSPSGPAEIIDADPASGLGPVISPAGCDVTAAAASADGRVVDLSTLGGTSGPCAGGARRWRWDRATGTTTELAPGLVAAVSRDGTSTLYAVDTAQGENLRLSGPGGTTTDLPVRYDPSHLAALSADGSTVVLLGAPTGQPFGVYRWTRATARFDRLATSVTPPAGTWNHLAAVSADGRTVAFWSDDPTLVPGDTNGSLDLFLVDTTAGTTRALTDVTTARSGDEAAVAMTPTASVVTYSIVRPGPVTIAADQVQRWERSTGVPVAITRATLTSAPVAISPDGATILFSSFDTTLAGPATSAPNWQYYQWHLGSGS
jgi:hypothetical protein